MTYLAELHAVAEKYPELANVRLVVFDVDGVLTNGSLNYTSEGEGLKTFHVRDGVSLKLLPDMGIEVAVVTAKNSPMVSARMKDLGIKHYYPGSKDKVSVLNELCDSLKLNARHCAYVGDDMVDLEPMQNVSVSLAPADAYPLVTEKADVHLPIKGGEGVARYVCDLVLAAQGLYEKAYTLAKTPDFERKR